MNYLGKFEPYEPPKRAVPNANHLANEKGEDWYNFSWDKQLTGTSLFLCTDDSGYVVNATKEGHILFPHGLHVYQVSNTEELYKESPDELYHGYIKDNIFTHKYKNDAFYIPKNEAKKANALKKLRELMAVYQVELALGTLTDSDRDKLTNYAKTYKEVDALDTSDANMTIPDL